MKMAEKIEPVMFVPCGMNCQVCYHVSLMENSQMVKMLGMSAFLEHPKEILFWLEAIVEPVYDSYNFNTD